MVSFCSSIVQLFDPSLKKKIQEAKTQITNAKNYEEWAQGAKQLDTFEGNNPRK